MTFQRQHNQIHSEVGPTQLVAVSSLTFPRSFRVYSGATIKKAARFIETFGIRIPILVDTERNVIAGEIWALAAKSLDLPEIPALFAEGLTPSQLTAYRIGIERIPELGDWDEQALGEIFKQFSAGSLDFDIEIAGFSMPEIDGFIGNFDATNNNNGEDPIEFTAGTPVTQPGILWHAGTHRVLCGNSLEVASFQALMAGQKASMVITDPPYNVRVEGHVGGKGSIHHPEFAMASGEMSNDEFIQFLEASTSLLRDFSTDGSLHYLFMDWRHVRHILEAGRSYSELKNIIVWVKSNAGMGSLYRSQHELVFLFKNGKTPHRNNVELGKHGRNRTNVWSYPGATSIDGRSNEEGHLLGMHPTVKPVQMIADAILDSSARGEIILDAFLGSGSTLLAAERVGRRLYGIEIDPRYVDVAVRRWQRQTGDAAIDSATGLTFDQTSELSVRPSDKVTRM
jgi:DNA modification methylase